MELISNYRMYQSIATAQLGTAEPTGVMPCKPGSCISG